MIQGEADDLIRRVENLEIKQLHAQKEKIKNREQRIRLIGKDQLYSKSPEDIVIEKEERRPLQQAINCVIDKFTRRRDEAFTLHECGYTNTDIANIMGVSRYVVGRELKAAEQELRNHLKEDKSIG